METIRKAEAVITFYFLNRLVFFIKIMVLTSDHVDFEVTRLSYFVGVPPYFKALWYPRLYFDRKSNT